MRGVVEIEEDSRGRTGIVTTSLPYQVFFNHDNFITSSIADQVPRRKLAGISNIEDQAVTGRRHPRDSWSSIKRDASCEGGALKTTFTSTPRCRTSFGAQPWFRSSTVGGLPRTLRLDQMIRYYVEHQLDVIVRRTTYRLRKAI